MITFTSLHRLLGQMPGPVTDEMVDLAVTEGLAETTDLDWKSKLPDIKGLSQQDFPKDVAAMANSGGGVIVFGIEEKDKKAMGRVDVGVLTEQHERALRSVAVSAISPPIMGLDIQRVGDEGAQVVVVAIPPTIDGPHLIYRENYFGAPIRNDADTVWMKERQIEAMYRVRFSDRLNAKERLDDLYAETMHGRDDRELAWLVAVAHPRLPASNPAKRTQDEARDAFRSADSFGRLHRRDSGHRHPLGNLDLNNPRPGLRRWKAVYVSYASAREPENNQWLEAEAAIHHDGSVTLATAIGGRRIGSESFDDGEAIQAEAIEIALSDFMGLLQAVSREAGLGEYETRIGIECGNENPMFIYARDAWGDRQANNVKISKYTPVSTTILADAPDRDYSQQLRSIAEDCINQGGVHNLTVIREPDQ